jgi:nucleoside 2-deoxyribosyltransferase
MKYYIATSTERMGAHNAARDLLNELGHEITKDWTTHGSVRNTTFARLQEVAHEMVQGVMDADFVLVLLPGGKGTHTELGLSLASGKKVFIHSEDPQAFALGPQVCAFYHHANVTRLTCPLNQVVRQLSMHLPHRFPKPVS